MTYETLEGSLDEQWAIVRSMPFVEAVERFGPAQIAELHYARLKAKSDIARE